MDRMDALLEAFLQPRSYQAAGKLMRGEPGGLRDTLVATAIRSAITLPGLLVVGIPTRQAILGATLGNVLVSVTVIGYYLHAGRDAPDPTQ